MAGLAPSFGRGAMTNHWVDIRNADLVLVMGGNAAEAHPVGFRWAVEARNKNNAKILVIDPRFNRTAAVADKHVPIRPGTDIAFLNGVINYLLANGKYQTEYVHEYTSASFLVNEGYNFNVNDGLFSGWDKERKQYDRSTWSYQLDSDGYALRDPSLKNPLCVLNVLKKHVSIYTPEVVSNVCGVSIEDFKLACEWIAETSAKDKVMTNLYALGWTEHTVGTQNIRCMAIMQLLLGNIGMPGGGINALRGHCNVQGITDLGIMSGSLPGYLTLPSQSQPTLDIYLNQKTPKPQAPNQVNYWGNYPKFFISQLKSFYGDAAKPENEYGYQWLPKWNQSYDTVKYVNMMINGEVNGFIVQGYNFVMSFPDRNRSIRALSKLKYLVVIDPLDTETANFWKNYGEFSPQVPEEIDTEVFNLPSSLFAEEEGSITNSSRWLQWHWAAGTPPGEGKTDSAIVAEIFLKVRELYKNEGGKCPEQVLNITWDYSEPHHPSSEELAKEINGRALVDIKDANGNVILKKGQLLSGFAQLRDDGTTSSGCWIYSGCWTEAGNMMARRDPADPSGLGNTLGWSWAWPANRRILYNRASMDRDGQPWDPKLAMLKWNGSAWAGYDIPDFNASPPGSPTNPFIMQADGVGDLFSLAKNVDGPLPTHWEPMESPLAKHPIFPDAQQTYSPTVRIFKDNDKFGSREEYPYVATTYRLTEHFHTLTKDDLLNAITQPEAFAEISETLAEKVGVKAGDRIKIRSFRGYMEAVAVVTKRIKPFEIEGEQVELVGLPIHWGYMGEARKAHPTNNLTLSVGDSNTYTPEFKAFLVNVEKA